MGKKKIVIGISSSFCANFLRGQIAYLNQQGFEVVIISGAGEEISLLAKEENAKLYNVKFTKSFSIINDVYVLVQLIKILRKEKPQIINAGNPKSGFLIMVAAKLVGNKNRIFTLHGLLSDTKVGIKRSVITYIEKISCLVAKRIFVVSPSLLEHAAQRKILNREKAICLGYGSTNGVNTNLFSKTQQTIEEAKKLKSLYGIDESSFVIGFVGRISKDKGIEFLLDSFLEIKKRTPEAKLFLVGPYEQSNCISEYHKSLLYNGDGIYYLGKAFYVVPFYLLFDVLALTSFREGFGNVLIEAAAMEVPVIATNIPGCKDALEDNVNGFLFEMGNKNDFIEKINIFIMNPQMCKQFGHKGREMVQKKFINKNIWDLQNAEYEKLIVDNA
jgi:glycosyltransferase involved in cell wall biosynthesis